MSTHKKSKKIRADVYGSQCRLSLVIILNNSL